jgi:hypothetical protein
MANSGNHGAPLPASTHTTVTQNVGGLLYAAVAPGVGHHGGCGKTAAVTVDGARLTSFS